MSGYTVICNAYVEALLEEYGDLDEEPFWKPERIELRCQNQGAAFAQRPCGFCHEGPCVIHVLAEAQ